MISSRALWPAAIALALAACSGEDETAAPAVPRVASVEATAPMATAREWCDVYFDESSAPPLALPDATPTSKTAAISAPPKDGWIWVNLWATWCGPCLREIPMIQRWITALNRDRVKVEMWFLSLDDDADELGGFLSRHPDIGARNSVRLNEPDKLGAWIEKYSVKPDTGIPINILAAPGPRVRCIRTGAISDSDFPVVRDFLETVIPQ